MGREPALIVSHVKTKGLGVGGDPKVEGRAWGRPWSEREGSLEEVRAANKSPCPSTPPRDTCLSPASSPARRRGLQWAGQQLHRVTLYHSTPVSRQEWRTGSGEKGQAWVSRWGLSGSRGSRRDAQGRRWSSVKSTQGLGHVTSHFTAGEIEAREGRALLRATE